MTGREPHPLVEQFRQAALAGRQLITRPDLLDERVMDHIDDRFEQITNHNEADRAYEFLKARLETAYLRNLRRAFAEADESEPMTDEALFIRMAKTMFRLNRREALCALGYPSYAEFAKAEAETAARQGKPFHAQELSIERLKHHFRNRSLL